MNEMNPRMKRKYPKQWEPRDLVVTIPFLVEDRKRLLFITRLIGSAVDTRETSTRQAKRVRGQQAKSYDLIFVLSLLRLKSSSFKQKGVGILHAGKSLLM
jgi:hypothetical protein